MSNKRSLKTVFASCCGLLILLMIGVTLWYASDVDGFIEFCERHFSPDQDISDPVLVAIRILVFLLSIGLMIALFQWKLCRDTVSWLSPQPSTWSIRLSVFFAVLNIVAFLSLRRHVDWFAEDNFFENATAIFVLLATVILILKAVLSANKTLRMTYCTLALVLFVFAMEEISWGQRIFGWQSPSLFELLSYQNETNLHNLFNPLIALVTTLWCALLAFLCHASYPHAATKINAKRSLLWHALLPNQDNTVRFFYFGYIFWFLLFTIALLGGELFEEVFALFALVYAIDRPIHALNDSTVLLHH